MPPLRRSTSDHRFSGLSVNASSFSASSMIQSSRPSSFSSCLGSLPQRLRDFVERRRRGAVLEGGEAAVNLRRCVMKAARQAGGLEACGDLLHLGNPAPGFVYLGRDCVGLLQQARLRKLPFFQQTRIDAFALRQRPDESP